MGEFTPINTQEELNAVMQDRIARLNEKHAKEIAEKYGDYDELKSNYTSYETKTKELTDQLEQLTATNKDFETKLKEKEDALSAYSQKELKIKVATEAGLALDSLQFLNGTSEEELRQSATNLKALIGTRTAPIANPEIPTPEDGVTAAFRKLNPNIKI